jgi:hypothetical protein
VAVKGCASTNSSERTHEVGSTELLESVVLLEHHQQNPELGAEKSPYMHCYIWHIVRYSAVHSGEN